MQDPGSSNRSTAPTGPAHPLKLTDRLREALRARHYSVRTEQAYVSWVRRYVRFHQLRHPREMAGPEITAFLTYLALNQKVSASTQDQALSAMLFLYRHVIGRPIGNLGEVVRARRPERLPVVMSRDEVSAVLTCLQGDKWLAASLMHGAGLRLMECLQLRVQDISFASSEILVRNGKGGKDRVTIVSTFFGIVIRMFYRVHGGPHSHAEHQGQQGTFTFDGELLAGGISSRTALRLIKDWSLAHQPELGDNWSRCQW